MKRFKNWNIVRIILVCLSVLILLNTFIPYIVEAKIKDWKLLITTDYNPYTRKMVMNYEKFFGEVENQKDWNVEDWTFDQDQIEEVYDYQKSQLMMANPSADLSNMKEDITKALNEWNSTIQKAHEEGKTLGEATDEATEVTETTEPEDSELEGADKGDAGGVLFSPIAWLLQAIGDTINLVIQRVLTGSWERVYFDSGLFDDSKVVEVINRNPAVGGLETIPVVKDYIKGLTKRYGVPEIRLTPAEIFAGNVAALDANFFEPEQNLDNKLGGQEHSIVLELKKVIAKWYVAIRNIAIVGLLSVLLYIGIRIVMTSSAGDKAKYKQMFIDWVIALCLVFFMHYIMSFTMTMSETITDVLAGDTTQDGTIKQVNVEFTDTSGGSIGQSFSTNFTGVARIKADYKDSILKMGYSILYLALTAYTVYFAIVYLKRLLMLAFFTLIAPLVALTYPIDKIKDGKAQAFNYWFKEYMFYALLQPMHMMLYTILVGTALSIAANNLLYAIVALAFIVPAEKILKQMFGIKGQTESSIGGFAGGALATQAFNSLKSLGKGGNAKPNMPAGADKIRTASNPNSPDPMNTLTDSAMRNNVSPEAVAKGAAMTAGGASAAAAFQNSTDVIADTEREALEDKLADGQLTPDELTAEQKALLGIGAMNSALNSNTDKGNNGSSNEDAAKENMKIQPPKPKVKGDSEENKFKAYRKQIGNNFKKAVNKRYVAAGGWKGMAKSAGHVALKGAKGAAKGVVKFETAALGAALGASMGIVGGDLDDVWKGGAAGIAAGVYTGGKINKSVSNQVHGATGRFFGEVFQGDNYDKNQFVKQYMNNADVTQRIMQKNPNITADELTAAKKAQAEMAYDAKLSDYSDIKGAVSLEKDLKSQGVENSHEMAVATAKMAKNYDNSTFTDKKKFENAQKQLQEKLEEQMTEQIEKQFAKSKDQAAKKERLSKVGTQADVEARKTLERISRIKGI